MSKFFPGFFLPFLIFIFSTRPIAAQWVQTTGPGGGTITAFAVSGSTLFAGTEYGGIYRSTNNGESWTLNKGEGWFSLLDNRKRMYITSLAITGEKLFAGSNGSGVFCSTDQGVSWIYKGPGLAKVTSIAVLDTNIFVSTNNGIYRSSDYGDNWTAVLTNTYVYTLIVMDNYVFAGTNGYGLLRSTNNGNSWDIQLPISGNVPPYGNVEVLGTLDTILFAKRDSKFFRSTDNGTTWTNINDSLPINALVASGENLFASKDNGEILCSTDNGETWTVKSNDLYLKIPKTFTVLDNYLFVGTENYGVYRSTNNGENWSAVNYGLANTTASTFTIAGPNLFVGTQHQGVFLSTNNGTNWEATNNGDFPMVGNNMNRLSGVVPVNALVASEGNLLAGTDGGGIFRSTNNGNDWAEVNNGLISGTGYFIHAFAISDTIIYAGTGGGVYHSANNGESWTLSNSSIKNLAITSLAVMGNTLYAGCSKSGVGLLYSVNNGANWDTIKSGNTFLSLAVLDTNLFVGTLFGRVYQLINDTLVQTEDVPGLPLYSLIVSEKNIFAKTYDGVFLSTNYGSSWIDINDGLPYPSKTIINSSVLNTFAVDNQNIFIGTADFGVWKRPLSEVITSVDKIISSIPTEHKLSQNYPNPFNSSTIIEYDLTKNSYVKLSVFDVLGREIKTIVDEEKSAGSYSVRFNANDMASGIYFYTLQTWRFTATKKLLLLK